MDALNAPGAVFLDDRSGPGSSGASYILVEPSDTIVAHELPEVPQALQRIGRASDAGMFVAGYIAYEAGASLDKPIAPRHAGPLPLVWFGVYRTCSLVHAESVDLGPAAPPDAVRDVRLSISESEYTDRVQAIREYILAGDVYQVNFTCKLLFEHMHGALGLFSRLRQAHPVCHSAFVNLGDAQIVSLSPELFLRREGDRLTARPMKGTARRGRWADEDEELRAMLAADEKNRAENVMIVDLMRNDIGRLSQIGTVTVPRMFHVEQYATLFQMTSDVAGRLRDGVTTEDVLRATFPPGSVTGAPKIRAMEIIRETERDARGPYCGAIGLVRPGGDMLLNVAIRTIVQMGTHCEMGIGGGIVADSSPREELREAVLKSAFLRAERRTFDLIETIGYRADSGPSFLTEHLDRMERSARYFGWAFDRQRAAAALALCADDILAHRDHEGGVTARVRLRLTGSGAFSTEWTELEAPPRGLVDILVSTTRVDPDDVLLYHKTTQREWRDSDLRTARAQGFYEVLYLNTLGQVTEGAFTNLVVEMGGHRVTPPISCGLLPGIWRQAQLDAGATVEQVLTLDDLAQASRIWIGNSVRGAIEVSRVLQRDPGSGDPAVLWSRTEQHTP